MSSTTSCRERILVVDDEVVIADTLKLILCQAGYEALAAYSGEEACRLALEFRPDILVSDIKMPRMNGIESSAAIVQLLPNCPVLLISGHVSAAILEDERIERFNFEVLSKPVPPQVLLAKIASKLAAARARDSITVVNVDDFEISRYAVSTILRHAGFLVKEAGTGSEALELARSRPDLILLDIHLPDMTGFEVCRQLRACPETASIPIVHLTNTCRDEESRQLALRLGANEYLTQPVEPEPLVALLSRLAKVDRPGVSSHSR